MKINRTIPEFFEQRLSVIEDLCLTHKLTTLIDFGLNHFLYDKLSIQNIIGIEINSENLTYGDNYSTINGNFHKEVFKFIQPNTCYTYFCFSKDSIPIFIEFMKQFYKQEHKNSYLILWNRINKQTYKIYNLEYKGIMQ